MEKYKYPDMVTNDRYIVVETSDAFEDIEDSFAIYDNKRDDYYINIDGMVETFETEDEAEILCKKLNQEI